jgi:hypothetical protein
MWKLLPVDPADERFKHVKLVAEYRNQFWFEAGPECVHKEPKPGRPIPDEDKR